MHEQGRTIAKIAQRPSRRSLRVPSTVLITGASGGIGAALARDYAQPGRTLILHGRDVLRLDSLTRECKARGAEVHATTFDLKDAAASVTALRSLSSNHVIDLAIVNAGITRSIGEGAELESWDLARQVLAVNLDGAIATIAGVLPEMRRRGAGQIAIVSSLAAYVGLPDTPTYCASKAALKVYGEALRGWLAPRGIAVNVIMPGYVRTPMNEHSRRPMPFRISPEEAAARIRRGLERNRARIAFPRRLAWVMWLLSALPASLAQWMLRTAGFGDE